MTVFTGGYVKILPDFIDSILFYNTDRDTWQPAAGNMTVPRAWHAVAVFPDVSQLCP